MNFCCDWLISKSRRDGPAMHPIKSSKINETCYNPASKRAYQMGLNFLTHTQLSATPARNSDGFVFDDMDVVTFRGDRTRFLARFLAKNNTLAVHYERQLPNSVNTTEKLRSLLESIMLIAQPAGYRLHVVINGPMIRYAACTTKAPQEQIKSAAHALRGIESVISRYANYTGTRDDP